MKINALTSLIIVSGFYCCKEVPGNDIQTLVPGGLRHAIIVVTDDDTTPTVKLPEYTLINDPHNDHLSEAREIIKVKRQWPLAMQSLDPSVFELILSSQFTFKETDTFFNRADYIRNRTTPDQWKIVHVDYDNVTLQFFGSMAVLSYRNHVQNKNAESGEIETEHMTWVDTFIKEDGAWKIDASHTIDYRLEVNP
jgi:hypothetical protein